MIIIMIMIMMMMMIMMMIMINNYLACFKVTRDINMIEIQLCTRLAIS